MNVRLMMIFVGLLVLTASLGAGPASKPAATRPTTKPGIPELTDRQRSLLIQLADAEANIQAINIALRRSGYKVGQAYDRINSNLKGIEMMDRKGGGPVRWDEFYGKTARDFVMHDAGSPVYHQLQRPEQFETIYKANQDQINRARALISGISQDQVALLTRRQKHEADQSRLWAILAWEQIADRDIENHPRCLHPLKPKGTEAAVLRPLILFLRTADSVATEGLHSIESDQAATFQTGSQRMEAAFTSLRRSLADALDSADLKPERKAQGEALKALCKDLAEECKVIGDNYANALDRDFAKQDISKLEFREELQTSLRKFAIAVARLDDQVNSTATAWGVEADKSAAELDSIPAAVAKKEAAEAAPRKFTAAGDVGWVDLFNGKNFEGWNKTSADWKVEDGVLVGHPGRYPSSIFTERGDYKNYVFRAETMLISGRAGLYVGMAPPPAGQWAASADSYFAMLGHGGSKTIPSVSTFALPMTGDIFQDKDVRAHSSFGKLIKPDEWFIMEVAVNGGQISVFVDGKQITQYTLKNKAVPAGHLGILLRSAEVRFKKVQVKEMHAAK